MANLETTNAGAALPGVPFGLSGPNSIAPILPPGALPGKQAYLDTLRRVLPDLAGFARWVGWKAGKIPVNPGTGGNAQSDNPKTWAAFDLAARCYLRRADMLGVGFVFNGDGLLGIDLDKCVNPETGEISPRAAHIIDRIDSYTERSPSGTGVHILAYGEIPKAGKIPGVEFYATGRFFTVTGNVLRPGPIQSRGAEIAALWAEFFELPTHTTTTGNGAAHTQPWGKDLVLVEDALRSIPPWSIDYGQWVAVLMAIHAEFGDTGLSVAESWGQGAHGEVASKWRSFHTTGNGAGRVGLGTLFDLAKRFGWQRPRAEHPVSLETLPVTAAEAGQKKKRAPKAQRVTGASQPVTGDGASESTAKRPKTAEILTMLSGLGYSFRQNDLDDSIEVNGQAITDGQRAEIRCKLRDFGMPYVNLAEDAYTAAAYQHRYNPIREYLDRCAQQYDGGQHIGNLAVFFTDKHDKMATGRSVFHTWLDRWLLGAVGKVYAQEQNPMLVLDGPQALGKSYFVRWLASGVPDLFVEAPIHPDDKDASVLALRKLLWEVGELGATIARADVESLKHFISRSWVDLRPAYAHYPIRKPVASSFIGTVNGAGGFLNDATGSRRFLTVTLSEIDWAYARSFDPGQIWGQAVTRWQNGERGLLSPPEIEVRETLNRGHDAPDSLDWIMQQIVTVTNDWADYIPFGQLVARLSDWGYRGTQRQIEMALAAHLVRVGLEKSRINYVRVVHGVVFK